MHYRNGREAKNGDKIVRLGDGGRIEIFGELQGAMPGGGSHCNGRVVHVHQVSDYARLCDCLHVDDLAEILKEKGLDKRPAGM